jgi:hypothetical protein
MAMGDHGAGAEYQFLTYGRNRREDQQSLDVSIVFAFHPMRLEDQMISHPDGIEAIGFGLFRPLDAKFGGAILAKVR